MERKRCRRPCQLLEKNSELATRLHGGWNTQWENLVLRLGGNKIFAPGQAVEDVDHERGGDNRRQEIDDRDG